MSVSTQYYEYEIANNLLTQLNGLGLSEVAIKKLLRMYDSIQQSKDLDIETNLEELIAVIPLDVLSSIYDDIEELKKDTDEFSQICDWSEAKRKILQRVTQHIVDCFGIVDEAAQEYEKGTFSESLEGFWKKYQNPQEKDLVLDCRIPTMVQYYLLKREGFHPSVLIRYANQRFNRIPNFHAHPSVFIPVATVEDKSEWEKPPIGVLCDLVISGKGSIGRAFNLFRKDDAEPYALPVTDDLRTLVGWLDIYYFVAYLSFETRKAIYTDPKLDQEDAKRKVGEILSNTFLHDVPKEVQESVENYLVHLFAVPLESTDSFLQFLKDLADVERAGLQPSSH